VREVTRYALVAVLVVGVGSIALFALLDDASRGGALLAAGIVLPVQVVAFGLLARAHGNATRFLIWWGAGIALRVAVVAVVGVASSGMDPGRRAALVLSLVGFFFALLLLEPLFLKNPRKGVKTTA
jgi:hypothetical protein